MPLGPLPTTRTRFEELGFVSGEIALSIWKEPANRGALKRWNDDRDERNAAAANKAALAAADASKGAKVL